MRRDTLPGMDERLVPTRDIFLCQVVVIIVFAAAERLGYVAKMMSLGLGILAVAVCAAGYLGHRFIHRRAGAVNAYSVALTIGLVIYSFKWWVLD
jgi:uncharacterized protein YqgC (DUF456 family)